MKDIMLIFALLLAGVVIARWSIRRSVKRPKGGRYFKRKLED
jgi:hypothetical protein